MTKIRLELALAKAGIASRRKARHLIESARIKVNKKTVIEKGFRVDISRDKIAFDGKLISFGKRSYYILNKPRGVLSTASDDRGRRTVLDCVKQKTARPVRRRTGYIGVPNGPRLYPVGRLDKDTTGLLILTDDGALTYRLTHPKFGIERRYRVRVKGRLKRNDLMRLKNGVLVDGKLTQAEKVKAAEEFRNFTVVLLTLRRGRKREVRKMFDAIGYGILELKRIAYGPLRLKGLKEGELRELSDNELEGLKRCVGLA